jgi:hypothetical protein
VHAPTGHLDEEQHVDLLERQGLCSEEVDGDQRARLRPDELAPRRLDARTPAANGWRARSCGLSSVTQSSQGVELADDSLITNPGFSRASRAVWWLKTFRPARSHELTRSGSLSAVLVGVPSQRGSIATSDSRGT